MNKQQFIKAYRKLSEQEKQATREYWESILKTAIFLSTYEKAEKYLLWIREA